MKEIIIRMMGINDFVERFPDNPTEAIKNGSWLEIEYDGLKYDNLKNVSIVAAHPQKNDKGIDDRDWKCQITFEKDVSF